MQLSSADVLRILAIFKESNFERIHLQVGTHSVAVARGASAAPASQPADVLMAPRLGLFRPAVAAGARVTAQQPIATLDVLGTLHPVCAGCDGVVEELLAEEGALVEYAQPVARIRREAA